MTSRVLEKREPPRKTPRAAAPTTTGAVLIDERSALLRWAW